MYSKQSFLWRGLIYILSLEPNLTNCNVINFYNFKKPGTKQFQSHKKSKVNIVKNVNLSLFYFLKQEIQEPDFIVAIIFSEKPVAM